MLQTVFGDRSAGNFQIAHVVERVEIPDRGDAVLLEKLRVQVDDVAGLTGKTHHIDAAGKRLQIHSGSNRIDAGSPAIHFLKGIFLSVEKEALETGAAADLDIVDAGFDRRFESGEKVIGFDPSAEAGLKTVPERTIHEFDFFHFAENSNFIFYDLFFHITSGVVPHRRRRPQRRRGQDPPASPPVC